ncbi:MAG TPA: hypothetical protein PLS37_04410 [Propioniciclava tarda]|nr:hypothetical protein [Propioniciclava tarda]
MRTLVTLAPSDVAALACPWCGRCPDAAQRGLAVVRDGRTVGVLVLGAADAERDLCPPGASVIERLWVNPDDVGEHIGTQLVQRACALLVAEGGRCLIAYGTPGRPDCAHLPAGWLERVGFKEHVGGVQWRIELRRTVPVAELLADAVARLGQLVRPGQRPQPAGRVQRTSP